MQNSTILLKMLKKKEFVLFTENLSFWQFKIDSFLHHYSKNIQSYS